MSAHFIFTSPFHIEGLFRYSGNPVTINGFKKTDLGGEVAEWSKAQHWKCCVAQVTVGSNPTLSVQTLYRA